MTDKKFTDEEIIKGLNQLAQYTGLQEKYIQKLNAALDLINRQKVEIEELNKKVEELSEVLSDTIRIRYAEAKSEAIKEFAERLKKMSIQGFWETDAYVRVEQIDNLVKEMVGEEE